MLRKKYWFPLMNSMIDTAIDQCYECQVAPKGDREEPVKVTSIPTRPWDTVSFDHGGPSPDGHYNLVLIDKRTSNLVPRVSNLTEERPWHTLVTCLPESWRCQTKGLREGRLTIKFVKTKTRVEGKHFSSKQSHVSRSLWRDNVKWRSIQHIRSLQVVR